MVLVILCLVATLDLDIQLYGGRPIYVLPGGEYGDRRVVRGARPTRGSSLATAGMNPSNAAIQPSTARAQARQDVLQFQIRRKKQRNQFWKQCQSIYSRTLVLLKMITTRTPDREIQ